MIESSPSGHLAALTVPMDKRLLMEFNSICHNELKMSPEEATRKMIYQVLMQSAQMREKA